MVVVVRKFVPVTIPCALALLAGGCATYDASPEDRAQNPQFVAIFLDGVREAVPELNFTRGTKTTLVQIGLRACRDRHSGITFEESAKGLSSDAGGRMSIDEARAVTGMSYAAFCPDVFEDTED